MYYKDAQHFMEENGYDVEGTWYPRVTKIVGIKAKPALYKFYADMPNFEEGERVKEQSANEGTRIHEYVEKIFLGEDPVIPPSIVPAISAFRDFITRKEIRVEPKFVERRIVNTAHHYAGTCDALAWIDGKFGVLDIKTSLAIYRDYNLQTSAYFYALKPEVSYLATRWILRIDQVQRCRKCGGTLRKKGGRDKVRRAWNVPSCNKEDHDWGPLAGEIELKEFSEPAHDYRAFLGAKMLWEWEHYYWLDKLNYPMLLKQKSK